jgi:phosphoribosylanthranilate isomerase
MIDLWSPPKRGLVKICGIREPEHAVAAIRSGADLLGFVFAPSRRQVSLAEARACLEAARAAVRPDPVLAVGVFVDASVEEIESTVEFVGLDLVQLHGTSPHGAGLPRKAGPAPGSSDLDAAIEVGVTSGTAFVRAIATPPGTSSADVLKRIAAQQATGASPVAWFVDGYRPGFHGGTGARADWQLAAEIAATAPLILAGGLTPENVAEAIRVVRPIGVDVSGGVETDGRKDPAKIAAFVAAARAAFDGSDAALGAPA